MILSTQDHDTLQRILGKVEIPEAVEQEYEIRAQMFHTEGTGPLGIAMLVDLVRSLGYKPAKIKPNGTEVDWRQYPQDGRTKVEAMFFGNWNPGTFLGFGEHGVLMLRMDFDETIKEVRKDLARVVTVLHAEQVAKAQEQVDVRGHLIALEEESIELARKAAEAARKLERTKKAADRAAERTGGVDPIIQGQLEELTVQADAAKAAELEAKAKPKPIKVSAPAPKNAKPEPIAEPEVEYKEYVPSGPTTLEQVQKLEKDTPLFINPGNPEDDALEAVFVQITEDNLVQVLVDGEELPRVVQPADITLVT